MATAWTAANAETTAKMRALKNAMRIKTELKEQMKRATGTAEFGDLAELYNEVEMAVTRLEAEAMAATTKSATAYNAWQQAIKERDAAFKEALPL